ncbi:resolvase [Acinetobacter sp. neg1]|uniref:recombinase family protein n=1 Tax=Acinetobacter sp. neg1 TaxID=1561068 RepID=UPI000541A344|nr:helix-turn-helix domain-containing protein [Acinetobacter sp. neg1]KHF78794.1 resolvase [Acinetobacter sp. neg1]
MRTYAYIRVNPNTDIETSKFSSFFSDKGYNIQKNRLIIEEVSIDKSIIYRDKILNLINYSLEENDLLLIKSIDCLGCNFQEILHLLQKIDHMKIKIICFDYSNHEINGDLKVFFLHVLKIFTEFEINLQRNSNIERKVKRKVGRPEILNNEQKKHVIDLYKKGYSVYSIAKKFSVTRTVIQRLLEKNARQDFF